MKALHLVYIFSLLLYGGVFITILPRFSALVLLFILFLIRMFFQSSRTLRIYAKETYRLTFFCDFLMLWSILRWIIRFEFLFQQQVLIEQTLLVFIVIFWSNAFSLLTGKKGGVADSPDIFIYYFIWFTNLFLRVGMDTYLPGRYQMTWQLNYEQFSQSFIMLPIFAIALIKCAFHLFFSRDEGL